MANFNKQLKQIEGFRNTMQRLTDKELKQKTEEFKERLKNGETLDKLLPEAFAAVREATARALHTEHYPVQLMGGIALHNGNIAELKTGEGKEIDVNTPIPTPVGWKKAGNIQIGDVVFDRYGKPTVITGVYPQGIKQVYELELMDKRVIRCGAEHQWGVYTDYTTDKMTTMTTEQIYGQEEYKYFLPLNECVEYPEKTLPLDPYILGAFLSNGCKNNSGSFCLTGDMEYVKRIANMLQADHIKLNDTAYGWEFYKADGSLIKINEFDDDLLKLIAETYPFERYIPAEYKTASEKQRWALIHGIFNSDVLQFTTSSSRLKDDLVEVIHSLGYICSWISETKALGNRKYETFVVSPVIPDDRLRIAIKQVRKTDEFVEQVCFTVDNDEHLFLVGNYVVTHNTQTCFLPSYLNALEGKGVHVVTVNDYLAGRDAATCRRVMGMLGISVGCVLANMEPEERRKEYACDITYITNSEAGFDYLRDNMVTDMSQKVQRGLNYAIIDEVDSILIDEARTPLIISGQGPTPSSFYQQCDAIAKRLKKGEKLDKDRWEETNETGDYFVDEKEKTAALTERGVKKVEKFFKIDNYSDSENSEIQHGMMMALKANAIMEKNKDYVVHDDKVDIVDEFTGRILDGRRYSDGLHQAIEAKENVTIQSENMTIATITYQHYFNKYKKKAGMTGTAATEKNEFKDIYHMKVVEIPTNRPVIREDEQDRVYASKREKYHEVLEEIMRAHGKKQPVLVGTTTVETSELLSKMLKNRGVEHQVLNAKQHAREAEIVAHAGEAGTITIATNMAGRGTDIKPDEEALKAGGLLVIGTERHEARRIDNQLRGRSGRQGDPGRSVFFLSMEDDLMRKYGNEKVLNAVKEMLHEENQLIQSKTLTKAISNAQKRIEGQHYNTRKALLDYDDVNNEQREMIYAERDKILSGEDIDETIIRMAKQIADDISRDYAEDQFLFFCKSLLAIEPTEDTDLSAAEKKKKYLYDKIEKDFANVKAQFMMPEQFEAYANAVFLKVLDKKWMQHIDDLAHLREGINLKSYGQKDPRVEYKIAAYEMFEEMLRSVRATVVSIIFSTRISLQAINPMGTAEEQNQVQLSINKTTDDDVEVVNFAIS